MKHIKPYEQFTKVEELKSLENRYQVEQEDGIRKVKLNDITSEIEEDLCDNKN